MMVPAGVITLACAALYSQTNASALVPLTWFKLFTTLIFLFFVNYAHRNSYYYYYNLNISKRALLLSALTTDMILYVVTLIITHLVRPPVIPL